MKKHKLIFRIIIICLLVFPILSIGQNQMTVEDAIEIGLKNNFDIRIARKNAEISSNNVRLGISGFLPTLDISGNYNLSKSEQETNSPFSFGNSTTDGWGASVAMNWTLFDGFKMFTDKSRYDELQKLGEYQSRLNIERNVVGILLAYFNLVREELLLDISKNSVAISKDRLEKARVRNELGGASATDLLNAQVSLNNDMSNLLEYELSVQIAKKNLNITLGQNPDQQIDVQKILDVPTFLFDEDEIQIKALERNSAFLISQQNKIIAENNLSSSQSFLFPRLSLNGTYGYTDRTVSSEIRGDINTKSTDGSLSLNMAFNIFNGFRNDIDIQSKMIEQDIQQLSLEKSKNDLLGLVKEKYETYNKRLKFIELETSNVEAALKNLQLQEDRYATGATSSLEFRDAQLNYDRAQTALVSAKYQARIALLDIQQIMGDIRIE